MVSGRDLVTRDGVVKRRRTADKDVDVVGRRREEVLLKVVLGDETGLTLPVRTSLVNEEVELELLRVLALDFLKLLLKQNVVLRNVTVKERDLGLVGRVLRDSANQLEERSNTGTTTNEANFVVLVGSVRVLGNGTLEGNSVVDVQAKDVVTKLTSLVSLDEDSESAGGIEIRNRSVRSDNIATLRGNILGQKARGVSEAESLVLGELEGKLLGLWKFLWLDNARIGNTNLSSTQSLSRRA